MDQVDLFRIFTEKLEQADIDYMATGSVASMIYGIPRFTHDLDLIIHLPKEQIASIVSAFPLDSFYAPPEEIIRIEVHRAHRGHFNIIHHESGLKADIYLHVSDPLQKWGLVNKKRINLSDKNGIWVAPPEYVIVRKLEYYREGHSDKHLHDIGGMLEISGDAIDINIIEKWVAHLGLQHQWKQVQEQ